ncbi:MAG TPA: STAS domain-containing protein [bacterium]|nr:STAS domain-containing protein [bacterium]
MELGIEIKEKFTLLSIVGDMDDEDLEKLVHSVSQLMGKGCRRVVLDLTQVSTMSANGLGTLARLWSYIRFKRGDLKIVGLNSRLKHLFRAMGVEGMFETYRDVREMMEKTGRLPVVA